MFDWGRIKRKLHFLKGTKLESAAGFYVRLKKRNRKDIPISVLKK
jgi:hypothetical protein